MNPTCSCWKFWHLLVVVVFDIIDLNGCSELTDRLNEEEHHQPLQLQQPVPSSHRLFSSDVAVSYNHHHRTSSATWMDFPFVIDYTRTIHQYIRQRVWSLIDTTITISQ